LAQTVKLKLTGSIPARDGEFSPLTPTYVLADPGANESPLQMDPEAHFPGVKAAGA